MPGFWRTLFLLLRTARRRANGRNRRRRELLAQRSGRQNAADWSIPALAFAFFFAAIVQVLAGVIAVEAVSAAQRFAAERRGRIVVDPWFYRQVAQRDDTPALNRLHPDLPAVPIEPFYAREARDIARESGAASATVEQQLRASVAAHGTADFISTRSAAPGIRGLARTGRFPVMIGSLVLFWWGAMLIFQGEGLELDAQRSRHPLWEWLFSHPVPSPAVFLAEALAPIAANPSYWAAPLFPGILSLTLYGPLAGLLAVPLIGVPVTLAAATLGKSLEIAVILRFSARSRGGLLGLMSWVGYASLMLFLVGFAAVPWVVRNLGGALAPLAALPWPFLRIFLGGPWFFSAAHAGQPQGFSFLAGMLGCWLASAGAVACGLGFTVWGVRRGLAGADREPASSRKQLQTAPAFSRWVRDPLYRKELLWFARDRSAVVQAVLVPATVAGYQLFNLRGMLSKAGGTWNYTCGAAIFFGTYLLWVLGPKSLASEGQALWIALGWPRGLEDLLKTKARLWALLSTCLILPILLWAALHFRGDAPAIALLAVGWWLFARSMAEKSVTLVTIQGTSGQPQPRDRSRSPAAQLGMLTFALGIVTRQWHLAMLGIVFSWITAAAMWQHFRARLPFLYDPWSEKLPPPPTLMHAMVAVSAFIEGSAVLITAAVAFAPKQNFAAVQTLAYATAAALAFVGTSRFFTRRGVAPGLIWTWVDGAPPIPRHEQNLDEYLAEPQLSFTEKYGLAGGGLVHAFLLAVAVGVVLGGFAHGYSAVLRHIPALADALRKSDQVLNGIPGLRFSYAVMAVGFAPFSEEYLFRGLLFRALDREWGGWRAVLGAAAFFTVYHPLLSWLPVFCLGAANCLLFKHTRRLAPCVLLHMAYNAVVLLR